MIKLSHNKIAQQPLGVKPFFPLFRFIFPYYPIFSWKICLFYPFVQKDLPIILTILFYYDKKILS
ncbi:hypothetical protein BACCAP_03773 [Pseudoflavonifractor capillosus ATCC 29799]|uniref:Uncharacterized protein n=1 Tax=Pseudoflavonifractor capillosus ATCC 29799 TaxID=411467 RepID=A6NZW9_9FIRM|nr:hypothetical protein BACCAP_03773 [Pseudoflavonifractor capillosus ATCC 29799]